MFSRSWTLGRSYLRRSRLMQVGVIAGFAWAGQALAQWSRLPIPGSVLGMVMVLLLLGSGLLRLNHIRRGASWLLAEMLLFFVPAVMCLLDHRELMGMLGLKILAVIVLGTVLVMGGTALAIDLCYRWMNRRVC
ncbi:CidA/LrgA family protein [Bordetella genomosp. 12]|uniref:CidA/LrgA family protein n=1 Tax=Bordetella genomosp. 12 TaxID=463035 RepID=A0A261VBT1_9BORD|nr:CidA/LrgA family protein [Bordetella genomosp. 12]OZI71231.1 CidA/LrgA family protein [Bordetella genomosp. 12]